MTELETNENKISEEFLELLHLIDTNRDPAAIETLNLLQVDGTITIAEVNHMRMRFAGIS